MTHYDVIVIGIGGMGSATLYQLAQRGLNVLGLEQFTVPHEMGSSHGLTRIIRLAYYEDPSYVPLLRRSYQLWAELEKESGVRVFFRSGSIDAGPEDSEVFKGSLRSCQEHDLDHTVLNGKELAARFPGYNFPAETMAVFQPQGGLLVPERCVDNYARLAQKHGATLLMQTRVLDWEPTPDGVKVVTEEETYTADKLVITSGAWTSKLIPKLAPEAVAERQVLIWMKVKKPALFTVEHFPVWNAVMEEGRYYGFPEFNPSGATPGMKFGRYHHLEEYVDPDTVDREVHPQDEAILRPFAERYFPEGAGETLSMKVCMFTNTTDEHWILDHHPDYPQVSVAAGFSGHGFKMASVVGEIMADLAQKGSTSHDISLHRWDRLKV